MKMSPNHTFHRIQKLKLPMNCHAINFYVYIQCSPEFFPHMTPVDFPPGTEIEKVSSRHEPLVLASLPAAIYIFG